MGVLTTRLLVSLETAFCGKPVRYQAAPQNTVKGKADVNTTAFCLLRLVVGQDETEGVSGRSQRTPIESVGPNNPRQTAAGRRSNPTLAPWHLSADGIVYGGTLVHKHSERATICTFPSRFSVIPLPKHREGGEAAQQWLSRTAEHLLRTPIRSCKERPVRDLFPKELITKMEVARNDLQLVPSSTRSPATQKYLSKSTTKSQQTSRATAALHCQRRSSRSAARGLQPLGCCCSQKGAAFWTANRS